MIGLFYMLLGIVADLALPIYIGLATQDQTDTGGANLPVMTIFVLLIVCIGSIGTGMRYSMFSFFADNVSGRIRDDYFSSMVMKNTGFFDVTKVGEITSRQTDDINLVSEVLNNSFNTVVKSTVYTLCVLACLLIISPILVAIFVCGLVVLSLASGVLRRKTSQLNHMYQEEKAKLAQISEEVFGNVRTVKAFNSEKSEIAKFREIN